VSVEPPDKRRIEAAVVHLTPGKMNAARAAFKVGVKPWQIAGQFGLARSDVRKALASDASRCCPDPTAARCWVAGPGRGSISSGAGSATRLRLAS
jgi:hypothetical protein